MCRSRLVRLNCDNTDAVVWLNNGRYSAGISFRILSVVELYKHKFCLKVSTRHISGIANSLADSLSRGVVPNWLKKLRKKCHVNLNCVVDLLVNPLPAWNEMLST